MSQTGTGDGLAAVYYDNQNFTGTTASRIDQTVNFDWASGPPVAPVGADTFSVRWTGQVQAQFTQSYQFFTQSDDGVRLWVNGQLLIDNWTDHATTENSGSIALTAGQRYDIRMEYFENGGAAVARLLWSSLSTPKAVVPRSQLYSSQVGPAIKVNFQPTGAPIPAGYLKDDGAAYASRGNGYTYGWNGSNVESRDRNAASSLDQRYDTLIHLQKPSLANAIWEIGLPNGRYAVRIVSGDASHFDSVFRVAAEGVLTVNGTPTTSVRWIEGTQVVTVSDGRLTITNAPGAQNNKISFLEITPQ